MSEAISKARSNYDKAVMTFEKQLNPNDYDHKNSLVNKIRLSRIDAKDYEMKVFDCDKATKKMYEEYYKKNKYT